MSSQIRRSAASIGANIAEGYGRENRGSFIQYLRITQGSLKELETHVILCGRVELMIEKDVARLLRQSDDLGEDVACDDPEPAAEIMMFPHYSLLTTPYSLSSGAA
jgi:four helix bundle protein